MIETNTQLEPLCSAFRLGAHDQGQMAGLAEAVIAVLERTGLAVRSRTARELAAAHGASVDVARGVVRLPAALVTKALATAPRRFTLASRDGAHDLDLGSGATYGTTDGCGVDVVDWRTGERRSSTKADLADISRMQDYLASVSFWWPTVGAGDCGANAPLHELDAGWQNTVKHLQGMVRGASQAHYAVEMAGIVAGSAEELRRRPVLSNLIATVSPLVIDGDGIEAALVFAAAGVPVCFVSMPVMGTTAPVTRAGAIVLGMAEVLCATVLVQLAHPGAPVWGSIMHMYADPRTAAHISKPLDDRTRFLATELLHAFGLPSLGAYGGTVAESPSSWQAGVDTVYGLLLAALDGCETFTGIGLSDTYRLFTVENMILDDDLYHRARHAFLDTPMDASALALDVIDAVGPGGHFLGQKHTREGLRAAVVRSIAQVVGDDGGYCDPLEAAGIRAREILAHHHVSVPLADDKRLALKEMLSAADRTRR